MQTSSQSGLSWGDWVFLGLGLLVLAMAAGGTLGTHLDTIWQRMQELGGSSPAAGGGGSSVVPSPRNVTSPLKKKPATSAPPAKPAYVPSWLQHGIVQLHPSPAILKAYAKSQDYQSGNPVVALAQRFLEWANIRSSTPGLLQQWGAKPAPPAQGAPETWLQWLWYGPELPQ